MATRNFISKVPKRRQNKQRFNIDVETLLSLPHNVAFFWKDHLGHYLGCNDVAAESVKLNSRHEIVGLTNFDLPFLLEESQHMQEGDIKVMQTAKPLQFHYTCTMPHRKIELLSFKAPLYDENGKVVGIYGIDNVLESNNLNELKTQLQEAGLATTDIKLGLGKKLTGQIALNNHKLSKRQTECLYYLVQGMTIKGIARTLSLSPKTVEHYLDAIKLKLNCYSRTDLIQKAIQIPFIKKIFNKE